MRKKNAIEEMMKDIKTRSIEKKRKQKPTRKKIVLKPGETSSLGLAMEKWITRENETGEIKKCVVRKRKEKSEGEKVGRPESSQQSVPKNSNQGQFDGKVEVRKSEHEKNIERNFSERHREMRRKKVENKEKILKSNCKLNVQKELILREKVQLWEQHFDSEREVKKIGGTKMKRAGSLKMCRKRSSANNQTK